MQSPGIAGSSIAFPSREFASLPPCVHLAAGVPCPGAAGACPPAIDARSLAALIELLPDAAVVVDASGRVLLANRMLDTMLGRDPAALTGHPLAALLPPRAAPGHERLVRGFFADNATRGMQARPLVSALHADGSEVPVSITIARLCVDGEDAALALVRDATAFKTRLSAALARAEEDPLTGIGNRVLFMRRLRELCDGVRPFALLYIDLAKFKPLNDRHGHPFGDEVLRVFARRLAQVIRPEDVVARLGGDEFALIVRGLATPEAVKARIESIAASLLRPMTIGGMVETVAANVGAAIHPRDGSTGDALIERADERMYRAKAQGLLHDL